MNAIDTNVFIYALDTDDPAKQAKAKELIKRLAGAAESTLLPWQVAVELLSNLRKRESAKRISAGDVEAYFRDFLDLFPMAIPTKQIFSRSFALRSRFSLSHWDSMLLAACSEASVTKLYSEDLDTGTDYDGLTVVNPFV